MGYNLHITRAERWTDSEQCPIGRAEWQAFVESRGDLVADGSNIVLRLPGGIDLLLWWAHGQITVNKPFRRDDAYNDRVTDALARFAEDAAARLQGDDWETYETHAGHEQA